LITASKLIQKLDDIKYKNNYNYLFFTKCSFLTTPVRGYLIKMKYLQSWRGWDCWVNMDKIISEDEIDYVLPNLDKLVEEWNKQFSTPD